MSPLPSDQADFLRIPEAKREYNELLFAEVARRYDLVTRALSLGRDQAWKRALLDSLPVGDASPACRTPVCVDLACGTGDVTFALARRYPQATVCGVDLTPEMLAIARARNHFPNVSLELGDMHQLPFASASVDIVTGSYALRNAPALTVALEEIHRVLRPGGTAAFLDFSKSPHRVWQRLTYCVLYVWGAFWGLVLHRQPAVYAYIAKSLWHFPDRVALRQELSHAGFMEVSSRQFYFGTLEMITVVPVPRADAHGPCT
ncbi:MAG: ubiquinone/menaquinone biosynthesis methyltransferase [Planctomycetia bacterium]|nr:ubiquinone/menaquinone biosynthesis methyltransferase [Planctomycetia bacterium]